MSEQRKEAQEREQAEPNRITGAITRRGFIGGIACVGLAFALAGCGGGKTDGAAADSADGSAAGSVDAADAAGSAGGAGAAGSAEGSAAADALTGTADDPDALVIVAVAPDDPYGSGTHHATIDIADYGTVEVLLDADTAPITVSNFCRLADQGFYDGLTFHRIIKGFMIQGGDPKGDGTGGSDKYIKGEFSANGVENPLLHTRGAISMARSQQNDSASSQFFIMQQANHQLDGQYACFGHVTSGIEVVDAICDAVPTTDDNGTVEPAEQPVITSIKVTD